MIDPYNITNYKRSKNELEEFLLFCIVVAGKTAYIQARKLDEFLKSVNTRLMMPENINPFQTIKSAEQHGILFEEIKKAKLGQYKKIYSGFKYISEKEYNLNKMTPEILEKIPGVGMKTSRFFLLHSDIFYTNKIAILDTHILKFIKENIDERAPKSTPVIPLTYRFWEDMFLRWCSDNNKNMAEFDLEVWKSYARVAKNDEA
ncbi:MAG: Caulobacter phage CcrColossus [Bacteroidota bacterium]